VPQTSLDTNFAFNRMHKFALVAEWAVRICAALTAIIFLVSGVVYLWLGHWPVTHLDYWRIYDFCLSHTWLESALHKHYEHLIFFPSFFWLADLRFFHGNQLPLFLAGLTMLFLTVALLLIPIWRDDTVGFTAKTLATLVVIVGNFWMARSHIIASGGFNCICSLLMASAALGFVLLPNMGVSSVRILSTLLVVCAGFVASFSFGTGLAIWPTLLFLAWCLRLPWRSFVSLAIAAVVALVIYQQLPPHLSGDKTLQAAGSAGLALVPKLCRLVGSPFFYAASGWHEKPFSAQAAQTFMLSLWCGAAGLALAVIAMVFVMIRRDIARNRLKFIGTALITFNLVAMAIVVVGNSSRGPHFQFEFLRPRYLFWGTLFWTGLVLLGIQLAESKQWLRWPMYLVALALPVVVFPMHFRSALNSNRARTLAEAGATSLVNGVQDDEQIRILAPAAGGTKQVYRVAEELRARRLDMFTDGLQDWLGANQTSITSRPYKREELSGQCRVAALVRCDNGAPAARITGQIWKSKHRVPKTLVIVDSGGVVRGIGHSSSIYSETPFVNSTFYGSRVMRTRFIGYIRDYDPGLHYAVRSADHGIFSEEMIPVQSPTSKSTNP
jgi:hypothetical protein